MRKILHVVNISFVIPSFFGNQFNYLKSNQLESHIICSPSKDLKSLSEQYNFKFKEVPIRRSFSFRDDIFAIKEIYKYIKENQVDIVVGHTPKGALLSMVAATMANVKKRLFFRHGLAYETTKGIKRFVLKNIERLTSVLSTQIICVSPYLIDKSIKDKLSYKNKMHLLHKGSCAGINADTLFNPELIQKEKQDILKQKYNIPDNSFVLGFSGRISKDKGVEELLDAFILLQKKFDNIKLLVIGPLDERVGISPKYTDIIKSNKDIISTGLISNNIQYYYSLMNLFILPTHREGFGNVIIEASSMKIPILTTSHSGSKDAMIDGETGFYIDLNPLDIENKACRYIENNELRIRHGENGRKFVLSNFSDKIIWEELKKIYS